MAYQYKCRVVILSLALILTIAFFWGCASGKSDSSAGDLDPNIAVDPMYPHSNDWPYPAVHGGWVNQNDVESCMGCHQKESDVTEETPTCASCHPLFPHTDGWEQSENHGMYVDDNGRGVCATQCHGTDLGGGLSGVSCTSCHTTYPHEVRWRDGDNHGAYVNDNGLATCKTACHGSDLAGGTSGVSCTSCHANYPHASDWGDADNHGLFVNNNGIDSCATACHGTDLSGGTSGVSCNSCHAAFPHEADWADPGNHGAYVSDNGFADCATACHGADLQGGSSGVSCNSCHTAFPHQAGWAQPAEHGTYVVANGLANCATECHGADFSGGTSGISCASCHVDFPHTDANWTAQGSASVHAGTFIQRIGGGDATACQECHGAVYDRAFGGTSCLSCHPDGVTHMSGWSTGPGHGTHYSANYDSASTVANCKSCHGNPLAVAFMDTQAKTDLAAASDCYGCHWSYPHIEYYVPLPTDSRSTWAPADMHSNLAHMVYLMRSPLFTDSCGNNAAHANDPVLTGSTPACPAGTGALENTCGGSENGLCHFDGHRSDPAGWTSLMCAGYCH